MRQFPDAAGNEPISATLEDHLDVVASRLRLNAGSLDWRVGPSGGGGSGGSAAVRVLEGPQGERNGTNLAFTTSAVFLPQTLRFFVNGLLQVQATPSVADFSVSESQGVGTGYDTLTMAWAPLPQDQLLADYQPAPQDG